MSEFYKNFKLPQSEEFEGMVAFQSRDKYKIISEEANAQCKLRLLCLKNKETGEKSVGFIARLKPNNLLASWAEYLSSDEKSLHRTTELLIYTIGEGMREFHLAFGKEEDWKCYKPLSKDFLTVAVKIPLEEFQKICEGVEYRIAIVSEPSGVGVNINNSKKLRKMCQCFYRELFDHTKYIGIEVDC